MPEQGGTDRAQGSRADRTQGNRADGTQGSRADRTQGNRARRTGFHSVLVALYALFSLAAGARSAVQISTNFSAAPLAYLLSALAAVIYILATIALARDRIGWARPLCLIELFGVLIVGTASYLLPELFPDQTVWSHFGQGYLFIPLVLPIAALWWMRRTTAEVDSGPGRL